MPRSNLKFSDYDSTARVDPELKKAKKADGLNAPVVELSLDELLDAEIQNLADGQGLYFDARTKTWINKTPQQGQQGTPGEAGSQGPQGRYRVSIYNSVATGTPAPSTPTGGTYNGTTFVAPSGWTNVFPSSEINDAAQDVYQSFAVYDPSSQTLGAWTAPFSINIQAGPPGPAGATGPKGDQGDKGDDGDAGEAGPSGARGEAGATGPRGATGPQGERGEVGSQGVAGPQGRQGKFRVNVYRALAHNAARPVNPSGGSYNGVTLVPPTDWTQTFPSNEIQNAALYDVYQSFAEYDPSDSSLGAWSTPYKIDVSAGPPGPAGPSGARGQKGDKGDKGDQGLQGIQGVQGARGLQGLPGPKGDEGDKGPKGDAGDKGDQGFQGRYRLSIYRAVADGASTPVRPQGGSYDGTTLTSPAFWSGTFPSTQASDPDNFDVYQSFSDYDPSTSSLSEWSVPFRVEGTQGPAGRPGLQGPKGDKGDPGTAGATGPKGDKGDQGDRGDTGATGSQGARGLQGVQGQRGLQGVQGPTGPKGDQGDRGPAGTGAGFDFDSAAADLHEQLTFPVEQKPYSTGTIYFTSDLNPSTTETLPGINVFGPADGGWGTRFANFIALHPDRRDGAHREGGWGRVHIGTETQRFALKIIGITPTRIIYRSIPNRSERVKYMWVNGVKYTVSTIVQNGAIAGISRINPPQSITSDNVLYADIQNNAALDVSTLRSVKFEFQDGSFFPSTTGSSSREATLDKQALKEYLGDSDFTPSKENIYPPVSQIIKAGANIQVTPNPATNELTLSGSAAPVAVRPWAAIDNEPTDLTGFPVDSLFRVKNPRPGRWLRLQQNTAYAHGVKTENTTAGGQTGFSLVGTTKHGSVSNEEDGDDFTLESSPIGRIEVSSNGNFVALIRKDALSATDQARTTIYVRNFRGVPSRSNEVNTTSLTKGADLTLDGVVWQTYESTPGSWFGLNLGDYWRFFTSSPPTDLNSETLDFQKERALVEVDPPYHPLHRSPLFGRGTELPTTGNRTNDLFLRNVNGVHSLYIYTGDEVRNAVITKLPARKIDANILKTGTGVGSGYYNVNIQTDLEYVYAIYSSDATSLEHKLGLYVLMRRWSKSTGQEDMSWRYRFQLSSFSHGYLSVTDPINNHIFFARHSNPESPKLFKKPTNSNGAATEITINPSTFGGGASFGADDFYNIVKNGDKLRLIYNDRPSGNTAVREYDVDEDGNLINRTIVTAFTLANVSWIEGDEAYFRDIATGNIRAYNKLDATRVPSKDLNISGIIPAGTYFENFSVSQGVLYGIYAERNQLASFTIPENPGDIIALSIGSGGWQKAVEGVTFPDSSITSLGTGVPSNNFGVNGHFYFDSDTQVLYVKAGGVWHPISSAGGSPPVHKYFEASLGLSAVNIAENTERKVNISALSGITETGVTIANNELNFAQGGLYEVFCSMRIHMKAGTATDQNARSILEGYYKLKKGSGAFTIVDESRIATYVRAYDQATVAGDAKDWGYCILHMSVSIKVSAGDKLSAWFIPLVKQQAGCTYELSNHSAVEVSWSEGGSGPSKTTEDINALIDTGVQPWARTNQSNQIIPLNFISIQLTQAQYDALAVKRDIYYDIVG